GNHRWTSVTACRAPSIRCSETLASVFAPTRMLTPAKPSHTDPADPRSIDAVIDISVRPLRRVELVREVRVVSGVKYMFASWACSVRLPRGPMLTLTNAAESTFVLSSAAPRLVVAYAGVMSRAEPPALNR